MPYKLIAVDVDGTLLNSRKELTKTTVEAVQAAVRAGVLFVISTGRPLQAIDYFTGLLGIDAMPFILYNGALVIADDKSVLSHVILQVSDAKEILTLGSSFDTTMIAWSNHNLYVSKMNELVEKYYMITRITPKLMPSADLLAEQGITKILWYDDESRLSFFQSVLPIDLRERVNYHTSTPHFLEFVDRSASKANALKLLGERYGILPGEMIAIGDGCNDLSMIRYAGLGVAMGNAPEMVKAAAKLIAPTNDEDGVARIIRDKILTGR